MSETPDFYEQTSNVIQNDESIVFTGKKYDKFIKSHLDNYTFEDDKSKNIIALAKAMGDINDFKTYIDHLIQLNNADLENQIGKLSISEKIMDDLTQLAQIKNQLGELRNNLENQQEMPFKILGGQILVQNIDWKGGLKFSKGEQEWRNIGDDEITYNENTNRYEIKVDYQGFPKHLEIEYNGGNIIKIHDSRYDRVERIQIISKDISVQDISRYSNHRMKIESYQTAREIDIPFRGQRIKLQILFNK